MRKNVLVIMAILAIGLLNATAAGATNGFFLDRQDFYDTHVSKSWMFNLETAATVTISGSTFIGHAHDYGCEFGSGNDSGRFPCDQDYQNQEMVQICIAGVCFETNDPGTDQSVPFSFGWELPAGDFEIVVTAANRWHSVGFEGQATIVPAAPTATPTETPLPPTETSTNTPTETSTSTPTVTGTPTPSVTPTGTPEGTPTETPEPPTSGDLYCEIYIAEGFNGKPYDIFWTDLQSAREWAWSGTVEGTLVRFRRSVPLFEVGAWFEVVINSSRVAVFTVRRDGNGNMFCEMISTAPTPAPTPVPVDDSVQTAAVEFSPERAEIRVQMTQYFSNYYDPVIVVEQGEFEVSFVTIRSNEQSLTVAKHCTSIEGNAVFYWDLPVHDGSVAEIVFTDNFVVTEAIEIVDEQWAPAHLVNHICEDGTIIAMPGETISHFLMMANIPVTVANIEEFMELNDLENTTVRHGATYTLVGMLP